MRRTLGTLFLLSAFFIVSLPGVAVAAPADCAFLDVDDDGVKGPGDITVTDAEWLGGTAFTASHPFVVPAGCALPDLVTLPAPLYGVKVTVSKVTFLGTLNYFPPGGKGVTFIARLGPNLGDGSITIGDGVTSKVKIMAGGYNDLHLTAPPDTPAILRKSIALWAEGSCSINNAELFANRPTQDTMIGILCKNDVVIRTTAITGSGVNIQSLTGKIDASSLSPVGPTLADACNDPTKNLLGTGFPCQLDLTKVGLPPGISPVFNNAAELRAYCEPGGPGKNSIQALNDPLIMIAEQALDAHGASGPSGKTVLVGKYRVVLASVKASIDTSYTDIHHTDLPPGGAYIWLFASPTSVTRYPAEREDFVGPSGLSGAITNITGACYEGGHAKNPVQVGKRSDGTMPLVGVPDPPSCKQLPPDFVPILNKTW